MNGALFIMSKPVRRTLWRRREKRKSLALDDYESKDKLLESTQSNSSMTTLGKKKHFGTRSFLVSSLPQMNKKSVFFAYFFFTKSCHFLAFK